MEEQPLLYSRTGGGSLGEEKRQIFILSNPREGSRRAHSKNLLCYFEVMKSERESGRGPEQNDNTPLITTSAYLTCTLHSSLSYHCLGISSCACSTSPKTPRCEKCLD